MQTLTRRSPGTQQRRMSAGNESPKEKSAHFNADREARRSSLWHIPVLDSLQKADAATAHEAIDEKPPQANEAPPNLKDILEKGASLAALPDEARPWLLSFGDPRRRPNGDVATDLFSLRQDDTITGQKTSLLTLLVQWLPVWSSKAEKARKENRNARPVASKEQKNLSWLLQYVTDYLRVDQPPLDPSEVSSLVDAVATLCLNASRESDINSGIGILYTVASRFPYPPSGLEQSLVVLCAAASNLQYTPDHLFDCSRMLATGPLHQQFVDTLYSFIRTPTSDNNGKNLSHARGATRLLRNLIDEKYGSATFVLNLTNFLGQLEFAARQGIFRFCHDLLSSLYAVLSTPERSAEVVRLDFVVVVTIIRLCLNATPTETTGTGRGKPAASPTPPQADDLVRQYERHLRDRERVTRQLALDLERLRSDLDPETQDRIDDLFLEFPQFAAAQQLSHILGRVKARYLHTQDDAMWNEYSDKIFAKVVQDHSLPARCRIEGVEGLVDSVSPKEADSSQPSTGAGRTFLGVLEKLLQQFDHERDAGVVQALLTSLEVLFSHAQPSTKTSQLTMRTIQKLSAFVLGDATDTPFHDELVLAATKVLATIFSYNIHSDASTAVKSFDVLLEVAGPRCKSRSARLLANRVLFRIRADDAGFIYLSASKEGEHMASALLRTRASAEMFQHELPTPQRHSASSTSLSTKSDADEPVWMYPDTEDMMLPLADRVSNIVNVNPIETASIGGEIDMDTWLMSIIRSLQTDTDWETYSYTIVHAASQLGNIALFLNSMEAIVKLRQVLCEHIVNNTFREAPSSTGLKKSDVALCMFNCLTPLIPYATMKSEAVQKGFGDDLVRAFLSGIGGAWEGTSRGCIHALSICSLEIPSSVSSLYPTIVDKLSKNLTQTHLTSHILEFLMQVALSPELHSNFNPDEIQMIFGMCIQLLEKTREQHHSSLASPSGRTSMPARHSGVYFRRPPYRAALLSDIGLPQYAACLAYHNIINWFLSLRLEIRSKYVQWIVPRLIWKSARGEEAIDEQGEVLIDMMQRTAFSDLGETLAQPDFATPDDGQLSSTSWIVGLSIVTAETAGHTGITQITKRQASGTTYAIYRQSTAPLPSHHAPGHTGIRHPNMSTEILPPHVLLQLTASAAPTNIVDQPIHLPKDDFVNRALELFDRIPTVSSHKIGILYLGDGQADEAEFLANAQGSNDYDRLLDQLGYKVSLQPPLHFNPQGLEHPRDGEWTIAWRDRISELVYHIPTMMPTDLENDPQCVTKKAHVGNCHVNIVFNQSGSHWIFDSFKSQLNYVNIVITPACRARTSWDNPDFMPGFYRVQVVTRQDLPNISPAADAKIVSATQLGAFVRVLALNADMFCQTWNSKDSDSEFPSTWRARLQHIKRLRERVMNKVGERQASGLASGAAISQVAVGSTPGGRRTPVPRDDGGRSSSLASQLDFSSWTV